jgi:hypothetical protein
MLTRVVHIRSTELQNVLLMLRFTYTVRIACCLLQRCRITAERLETLCTSRQLALLLHQAGSINCGQIRFFYVT